jgi:hypothetical protein
MKYVKMTPELPKFIIGWGAAETILDVAFHGQGSGFVSVCHIAQIPEIFA